MPESAESKTSIEQFKSVQERLRFISRLIYDAVNQLFQNRQKEFVEHYGEEQFSWSGKEFHEFSDRFYKEADTAAIDSLQKLRRELSQDPRIKEHLPELNALIEAIRIMYIERRLVRYKSYELMTGAPKLTKEEIKEQDQMREDITEGRAILEWHILQNEADLDYLKDFFAALNDLWGNEGFKKQKGAFNRGLVQELGVYKLLKKHFPWADHATPKEDAHYGIDFWIKTKKGEKIMIQSKSSGMFGRGGIFYEQDIKNLVEKMETEPGASTDYYVDYEGQGYIPPLIRAKRLERDVSVAKRYAQSKGLDDPKYLLLISNSGNFKFPTGEVSQPEGIKKLEQQLAFIASH